MAILKFYGKPPPNWFSALRLGGHCPHCKERSRYSASTIPQSSVLEEDKVKTFVANYTCDSCLGSIPISWEIIGWTSGNNPQVRNPYVVLRVREPFDFEYVPDAVKKEIEEALDCLSVNAFNGFSAVCRRAIQAICTNLGAKGSTKVKKQIEEMADLMDLDQEWKDLTIQIMLSGHDGAHPHLPEVDNARATVMLSLLQDLTSQLYTRLGKVKESAKLRQEAINKAKTSDPES